jgi:hypothetical protein
MNWAITLTISEKETIESRLKPIVTYIQKLSPSSKYLITNIDATGKLGNQFTKKKNFQTESITISEKELLTLVCEEGQIFELDLRIFNSFKLEIIVRTGSSIDICGNDVDLPSNILGDYTDLDIKLFES